MSEILPPRTTPIIQLLDAEVIACIKRRYHQRLTMSSVDLVDSGVSENIYQVNLRMTIDWLYDIWQRLDNSIFRNSCVKTGLIDRM